jgi:hypothetical protein
VTSGRAGFRWWRLSRRVWRSKSVDPGGVGGEAAGIFVCGDVELDGLESASNGIERSDVVDR